MPDKKTSSIDETIQGRTAHDGTCGDHLLVRRFSIADSPGRDRQICDRRRSINSILTLFELEKLNNLLRVIEVPI